MAPITGNGASGSASLYKVWEIRALKRQKRSDEARSLLERVAKQVEPIMIRRRWKVPLLSEFSPSNARLLGLNINRGREIRIRLRPAGKPDSFFPYEHVLGTMLHELTHIERGPHDAKFYKLLDELNEECDDLIARGITGTPFGGSGHRLGSSPYPSIRPVRLGTAAAAAAAASAADSSSFRVVTPAGPSSAPSAADGASRKAAAAAAERRRQQQRIMMPVGGRRLGGDSEIMKVLSPVQAAAMAAERRMRDDVWCGGHGREGGEGGEGGDRGQGGAREKEEEEWESAREVREGNASQQRANDVRHDDRVDGRDDGRGGMAMGEGHGGAVGSGLEGDEIGAGRGRVRSGSAQSDASRHQDCDCNGGCDCVQGANGFRTGEASQAGGARKRPSVTEEQSSRSRKMPASSAVASKRADATRERFTDGSRGGDVSGGEQQAAGAGRAEGAEGVGREDNWTCRVCTLINRGIVLQCEACLAVRPHSGPASSRAAVTAASTPPTTAAGAAAAGTSADAAIVIEDYPAAAITGCGSAAVIADSAAVIADSAAAPGAMWTCTLCTLENAAAADRCLACDSLKVAQT